MVSHVVKHILTVYIVGFDVETAKLRVLELQFFYSPENGGRQIRKVSSGKFPGILRKPKLHIWSYFTLFSEEVLAVHV